jgi:uncharacterized protein (UPF0248 family)
MCTPALMGDIRVLTRDQGKQKGKKGDLIRQKDPGYVLFRPDDIPCHRTNGIG